MNTYLLNLWDTVRASYWFVPGLFALGAILLSFAAPWLDATVDESSAQLPEWILTTTGAARSTLSALAGAMMAVTGTVFSITVVTLSLTSQQFGPRLLRRFMYDLPTQMTLGLFLATGFYCLLILRVVEDRGGGPSAPHLSVLAAIVLAVLSMIMLIFFIHHVAMLIQAPHVVAAVARDLDDSIERLFPEKMGKSAGDQAKGDGNQEEQLGDNYAVVRSANEGYIQAIDTDRLMSLASEHDLVIRLRAGPGRFIEVGASLMDVWSTSETELMIDDLAAPLNETVITGIRRTPRQDVECAVAELVEVAVRSLSPGINDPFTAINCIDRLGAALGRLAERKLPEAHRYDDRGRFRVIAHPVTFADVLDAALNQIRQYGRDSVAVTIRLLDALQTIAEHVHRDPDMEALFLHATMIARAGEGFVEQHDRDAVFARFEQLANALSQFRRENGVHQDEARPGPC